MKGLQPCTVLNNFIQWFRNRYYSIYRSSGCWNGCEVNKVFWFWYIWKDFDQFTKPFLEFTLQPGVALNYNKFIKLQMRKITIIVWYRYVLLVLLIMSAPSILSWVMTRVQLCLVLKIILSLWPTTDPYIRLGFWSWHHRWGRKVAGQQKSWKYLEFELEWKHPFLLAKKIQEKRSPT